jgi:hypothetical protein
MRKCLWCWAPAAPAAQKPLVRKVSEVCDAIEGLTDAETEAMRALSKGK